MPTNSSLDASPYTERSTHSSVLWAHLLRKENFSPTPASTVPLPPLGPMDKTATSTRILLHDTQANLQQFAESVDKMTHGLNATKQEIYSVRTLFKEEHETLVGEMVNLVNRCQTEIKKPLGHPAQADKLEEFQRILELRLDNLDKRLDILQMLQATHSQTLQTQDQLLLSLKDQQTVIIASVSPLLPLLQALPLQIESIRNAVNELTSKALDSTRTYVNSGNPGSRSIPMTPIHKRATLVTSEQGSSGRKRRRMDENIHELLPSGKTPTVTKAAVFSTSVRGASISRRETITSRQSLATIVQSPKPQTPSTISNTPALIKATIRTSPPAISNSEPSDSLFRIPAIPATTPQPLFKGAVRSPSSAQTEPKSVRAVAIAPTSRLATPVTKRTTPMIDGATPSRPPVLPSPRHFHQTPSNSDLRHDPLHLPTTPGSQPHTLARTTLRVPMTAHRLTTAVPLRQRRSPFREGRRFIPLNDSDDSDE
ncbi:hypothetical protein E1B28_007184 [Marasmius oreades]|uniref:Uncharacterized protein n=1 Tax=Marasmius oreades TaxID=181124 RepID=A0A9P7S175_9AGAR|nr:uncharacterized protein E1B28_007184 [Marasmius oreades]KAG7093509.1 hypothetical protein E1B28_007184 [Marasmius oreades]